MVNIRFRTVRILDILAVQKTVKISVLTEELHVSHVTLRKDLDNLEKRGLVKRTYGYVSLNVADYTGRRMAINYLTKQKIAKAAAEIIEDGETVMLESGSCCTIFAEELITVKKNITIITNSIYIANYLCELSDFKIILLGGYFQPDSQVVVGPMTTECAEKVFSDKLFLGVDGFIPGHGFTGMDHLRVETVAALSKQANKIYVLTEAAKFKRRGTFDLIQLDKLAGVFTDDGIPKEAEDALLKNNVMLHKVPVKEEKIKWRKFPEMPPIMFTEKG